MAKRKITFESAMEELQSIYDELEQGVIGLDELEAKMKRVKVLSDFCQRKLRDIEAIIQAP